MISKYHEAYVWIWLPDSTKPIVAGKLIQQQQQLQFNYGQSYLNNPNAISIYTKELPLIKGNIPLINGLKMPSCIRDGSPDAWGRRVIINRLTGVNSHQSEFDELTYLLESGSDRIGALDFQLSPSEYSPRLAKSVSLEEIQYSASKVEQGLPLSPKLDQALNHGTSIGGARPKALIEDDGIKYIAKFSSSTDLYNVIKAEFIAMKLAKLAGLNVAEVKLGEASNKDILLIKRFDRFYHGKQEYRRILLSALTLFGLDEMMARYASYEQLAEIIRYDFSKPKATLKELFSRMVFNILCGNTDDHARNHAAIWDGKGLHLSPAYDICPQARTGNEASQAMLIHHNERLSQLATCMKSIHHFMLEKEQALTIIHHQINVINQFWQEVCEQAGLSLVDRNYLWQRQFLNPSVFYGFKG
ncbi:MAG: type II toxin-antitoxin system HipA family toxin [Gammaproteobacteria bacterium]|nr:type II toxin-antitoxin system HipA family toxin [Gammaproteobacteria bacterium]